MTRRPNQLIKPTADFLHLNTTTTMHTSINNPPQQSTGLRLTPLPKLIPLLLIACLAIATGCRDDDPSRYPSVAVPGYEPKDYVADLAHPNPEIVFNAVSALCPLADKIETALSKPGEQNSYLSHATAKAAYQGVLALLKSREPRLVAVSLRFLQLLGPDDKAKSDLVAPISQLESSHPLVQFEQVAALTVLATNTTQLPAPLLRRLLHSPSWMVSRATYQLIDKLQDETLRAELLARYPQVTEEREKLLILSAFTRTPGPKAIELLQQELLTASKEKIRLAAAGLLVSNLDISGVGEWLATHYPHFSPEAREIIIRGCARSNGDNKAATELLIRFLVHGYQPDADLLRWLHSVLQHAPETLPDHLQRLERAVRTSPTLGVAWAAEWQKRAQARARLAALNQEFPALAQEFTAKAQAMFAKHNIPADKQRRYLENLSNLESLQP
jgi:hypothetical protein